MAGLSQEELRRYSRHLVLEGFGVPAQLRLQKAKILVVGAGGLGSPVLLYLAAAGVGTIGISDDDRVDVSNLQRQVIFSHLDIGKRKAVASAEKITQLNPLISVAVHAERITKLNALQLIAHYDVVVDATDNFPTRYLLNDACVLRDKPLVYGSILKYEGQVAVFNALKADGRRTTNYRDLFPEPPDATMSPNCEQAGVLGVLPGMIGSMQANEAIKLVTGVGQPLVDQLLILDAFSMEQTIIRIPDRDSRAGITTLVDYEDFCGINRHNNKSLDGNQPGMKEVTVQELKKLKDTKSDFQLIDVREPHEFDICNLEGELIPMSEIPHNVDRISRDKQVILHCRSGKRSGDMLLWLEKNHGFTNLYNLKGGVLAWAKEIDPAMPVY